MPASSICCELLSTSASSETFSAGTGSGAAPPRGGRGVHALRWPLGLRALHPRAGLRALVERVVLVADALGVPLERGVELLSCLLRGLLGIGIDQRVLVRRTLVADGLVDALAELLDLRARWRTRVERRDEVDARLGVE
ncbi:hypothetical protein ACLESO_33785, partial [Pyxidicoccus sp. 3LG]